MKCSELGWLCIPLVVESYGAWGKEAMESFSSLASRLAITSSRPKSAVLSELYGRLNLNLVRANMRADIALKIISEVLFSFGHVFVCFVCPIIVPCIIIIMNNNSVQKSWGNTPPTPRPPGSAAAEIRFRMRTIVEETEGITRNQCKSTALNSTKCTPFVQ